MIKLKYLPLLGAMFLTACSASAGNDTYNVKVNVPASANGQTAFLVNFDTSDKIDSVMVENGVALFKGTTDQPVVARVIINGNRMGNFILEKGNITVDRQGNVKGGELNASVDKAMSGIDRIMAKAQALPQDSSYPAKMAILQNEYNSYLDSVIAANQDNVIGYIFFIDRASDYDLDQYNKMLELYPQMQKYTRTQKMLDALKKKAMTQPGNKFVDFTITNDSISQSLSDYVGNGRYTLVDFWASWCGPCIRETKVLKRIREEFKDQPLDILGVAVWDEPANTEAAIKRHDLPWPQIINAQSVPTDIYGISAIPCIILFGPDGTIISRDLQGEALVESVRAAINPATDPAAIHSAE
ncbi:MAG: AhpC/TSA family protein [Muribaculaceae bacterium]|nr:AhpC/TSA family protein [Muribaculaceae bacterium]